MPSLKISRPDIEGCEPPGHVSGKPAEPALKATIARLIKEYVDGNGLERQGEIPVARTGPSIEQEVRMFADDAGEVRSATLVGKDADIDIPVVDQRRAAATGLNAGGDGLAEKSCCPRDRADCLDLSAAR